MSVAFRRESDEEHLEPTFERPIPPGPNLVTPRGLRLIAAEVARLEAEVAAAPDDEALKPLARDLRYWRARHATAAPAPPPPAGEVGFGTHVTIRLGGRTRRLEIVGADEADPAHDRIGFQAPLARALMGAEAGETLAFNGGEVEVVAIKVLPSPEAS